MSFRLPLCNFPRCWVPTSRAWARQPYLSCALLLIQQAKIELIKYQAKHVLFVIDFFVWWPLNLSSWYWYRAFLINPSEKKKWEKKKCLEVKTSFCTPLVLYDFIIWVNSYNVGCPMCVTKFVHKYLLKIFRYKNITQHLTWLMIWLTKFLYQKNVHSYIEMDLDSSLNKSTHYLDCSFCYTIQIEDLLYWSLIYII